jgi:hypothetical protein
MPIVLQNITRNQLFNLDLQQIEIMNPAFIWITGDMADQGKEEEYEDNVRIYQNCTVPILTAIGNHDYRDPSGYTYYLAPRYYSRTIGMYRIIVLDTGATEGNGFFGEQVQWYQQQLQDAHALHQQILVGDHIPSTTTEEGGDMIAGNDEFRALNVQYNVRAIFAGHHHVFDAFYDNGSEIMENDPLSPAFGPYYIKSGSPTVEDNTDNSNVFGFRWVTINSTGDLSLGYDWYNNGSSIARWGMPMHGFNRTDTALSLSLTNNYNRSFQNITIFKQFSYDSQTISNPSFQPSLGTIDETFEINHQAGELITINVPANIEMNITFTPNL